MGQSAGAGSPVWFLCPKDRLDRRAMSYGSFVYPPHPHRITLTGRTKPYKAKRYTALGTRSTTTSREYKCSCGHVGWSNHIDLEHLERMT